MKYLGDSKCSVNVRQVIFVEDTKNIFQAEDWRVKYFFKNGDSDGGSMGGFRQKI